MSELPFGGATIDRGDELRHDPEQLAALLRRDDTVAVLVGEGGLLLDGERLARVPAGDAKAEILLGVEEGRAIVALPSERGDLTPLREVGLNLSPPEAGLAAYATALLAWHRTHAFCAFCGGASEIIEGGMARRCVQCGRHHFPRTDPVVIMAVENGDRLLMGRRPTSPPRWFSVLAGFVSPGETAEAAVAREVREESGIEVIEARYFASQPWPFPASLMLGFLATARDGEPVAGDAELAEVRWFTRAEVAAAAGGYGEFELPGRVSIARSLVDHWLANGDAAK